MIICLTPKELGDRCPSASTLWFSGQNRLPLSDCASKLSRSGVNTGQARPGGVEFGLNIEQTTNPNKLITDLIKSWIQLPGMKVMSVGRLEVACFFCRNTHTKPRHHIQGIDSEGPLKMRNGRFLIGTFQIRFAQHPMCCQTVWILCQHMVGGSNGQAIIATIHSFLRTLNQIYNFHERPPCGLSQRDCRDHSDHPAERNDQTGLVGVLHVLAS